MVNIKSDFKFASHKLATELRFATKEFYPFLNLCTKQKNEEKGRTSIRKRRFPRRIQPSHFLL